MQEDYGTTGGEGNNSHDPTRLYDVIKLGLLFLFDEETPGGWGNILYCMSKGSRVN